MTTDTGHFDLTRSFKIAPDTLWPLLTDARMREAWGLPDPSMSLTTVTEDLRVGGIERHRCGPADAPEFEVETRWYHIDGPTDATFTETLEFGGAFVATTLVTYKVLKTGAGCDLHVHVAVASFSGPEALDEIRAGWDGGLDSLTALADSQR